MIKYKYEAVMYVSKHMTVSFLIAFMGRELEMLYKLLIPLFLIAVIGFGIALPTITLVARSSDNESHTMMHHNDGVPCPDGDKEPCENQCPCFCCPGHLKVVFVLPIGGLEKPSYRSMPYFNSTETKISSGIHYRIFRPPRV